MHTLGRLKAGGKLQGKALLRSAYLWKNRCFHLYYPQHVWLILWKIMWMYLRQILIMKGNGLSFITTDKIAVVMRLHNFLLLATTELKRYIISSERDARLLIQKLNPKDFMLIHDQIIINRRYEAELRSYFLE